ncbi:hypothetical protein EYF80_031083 [Liparis tanakae]|uniref:Uncharacterized protein n=1 Tax=Liparis tanakae TaxID=230148 RepID=A0A4Z2GYX7_9TELE|nr:hypothetical protein EYF80_031083 [Liparis tanakae]
MWALGGSPTSKPATPRGPGKPLAPSFPWPVPAVSKRWSYSTQRIRSSEKSCNQRVRRLQANRRHRGPGIDREERRGRMRKGHGRRKPGWTL